MNTYKVYGKVYHTADDYRAMNYRYTVEIVKAQNELEAEKIASGRFFSFSLVSVDPRDTPEMFTGTDVYKACSMTGSAVTYDASDHSAYIVTRRKNGSVKVQRTPPWAEVVTAEYPSMKKALAALYSQPYHLNESAIWHPFTW